MKCQRQTLTTPVDLDVHAEPTGLRQRSIGLIKALGHPDPPFDQMAPLKISRSVDRRQCSFREAGCLGQDGIDRLAINVFAAALDLAPGRKDFKQIDRGRCMAQIEAHVRGTGASLGRKPGRAIQPDDLAVQVLVFNTETHCVGKFGRLAQA